MKRIMNQFMDATAITAGGAGARIVAGFIPLSDDGFTGIAKGLGVAVGVDWLGRQFLGSDMARMVAAGAMQVPVKKVLTMVLGPEFSAKFLGGYDNIGAYQVTRPAGVADYLTSGGFAAYGQAEQPMVEVVY
jgi:hypothetical protein